MAICLGEEKPVKLSFCSIFLARKCCEIHTHAHTHAYTRTHTHVHTCTLSLTHTHIHQQTHPPIHTHTRAYVQSLTYTHQHTPTHTHTHTHTHVHTCTLSIRHPPHTHTKKMLFNPYIKKRKNTEIEKQSHSYQNNCHVIAHGDEEVGMILSSRVAISAF